MEGEYVVQKTMNPEARRRQILDRLRAVGREWRVDELAAALGVSPLTIRRDLDRLAGEGAILRTLGGCLAAGRTQPAAYQKRVAERFALKQAIGRAAVREVRAGDVLLINDGSTTFHLASCLGGIGPLTVFTNSVAMIGELGRFERVRLVVLGGAYDRDLFYLGGGFLARAIEALRADTVFMGADAVAPDGRCLAATPDMARDARGMLRGGRRKILLADASKAALRAGVAYAALREFDLWITTPGISAPLRRRWRRMTEVREVVAAS